MEENHVSFDWSSFIGDHPLFGDLSKDEIDSLLDPGNSKQQTYKRGDVVFRAGEISNSFFLIGEGSVDVELASDESSATVISTFYRGDYFGEMSAIDSQDGRAATILAHEDCTLLEIKSKPFQQVIKANPEIEFKLLTVLASRLRHVNDHLLKNTRLTYDTKLSLLSEKIESQSKVVDASLDAAQAVFEQTKVRTSEIIESAERGRARLTWMLSILTTGFTLLFAVLGFFGYSEFKSVESNANKIDQIVVDIEKKVLTIERVAERAEQKVEKAESSIEYIDSAKANVDELKNTLAQVDTTLDEQQQRIELSKKATRTMYQGQIPVFLKQVDEKVREEYDAEPEALGLILLDLNDPEVTIKLFKKIFSMVADSHGKLTDQVESEIHRARISFFTSFMYLYIYNVDSRSDDNKLAQFLSSYLLLITYAMDDSYARDNDFYHNEIDENQYPIDGYTRRLQELQDGRVFDREKINLLTEEYNLANEFGAELNRINNPEIEIGIAEDQKIAINQILGFTYEPRS